MKRTLIFFMLTAVTWQWTHAQLPKGDRILAWQVDPAENNDYDSAFAYAQAACAESVHLFFKWTDMEPDTGNYDAGFMATFLDIINVYYPAWGVKAELQIAPVNTTTLETPSELAGMNFDDPVMIARFRRLLDSVFAHIPDLELAALNIGNESDIYFGTDSLVYARFRTFLDSVAPYAKQRYFALHGTELEVGTTFTLDGLTQPATAPLCQSVNAARDIVTMTYYPLYGDHTMKPPSVVTSDFASLVSIYNDTLQPIYFAECGYSSSTVCNSSEAQQAQFYTNLFDAWDTYSSHIPYLTIFKSTDWPQALVDTLGAYYGISDTVFLERLRTLGVRTWPGNGTNKLAYEQILCELDARNWCGAVCPLTGREDPSPASGFRIFPNPATESATLDLAELGAGIKEVRIYDTYGRLRQVIRKGSADRVELRRAELHSGVYFVRVITEIGRSRVEKLVFE